MRIHHLNCGTLCPAGGRWVQGDGPLFARARLVCHCLLIEARDGLILVDTGLGTRDIADPTRLGARFLRRTAPRLDPLESALDQVMRLGFRREDVRHLVPTHLDLDHAGGLADFPDAAVHVFHTELEAARVAGVRSGYRPVQWEHAPKWASRTLDGERWLGFDAVRAIPGVEPEVLLVPLAGHSVGHCGVAVKNGDGWLLHAGDAYFSHLEMDAVRPRTPLGLALFQRMLSTDDALRKANQERLRALARDHASEVDLFCAHSAVELERFK